VGRALVVEAEHESGVYCLVLRMKDGGWGLEPERVRNVAAKGK